MTSSSDTTAAARSTSTSDNGETALTVEVQRDSNVRTACPAFEATALQPVAVIQ